MITDEELKQADQKEMIKQVIGWQTFQELTTGSVGSQSARTLPPHSFPNAIPAFIRGTGNHHKHV